jgi:hypothetical protein
MRQVFVSDETSRLLTLPQILQIYPIFESMLKKSTGGATPEAVAEQQITESRP